jgi:hypothetical protein
MVSLFVAGASAESAESASSLRKKIVDDCRFRMMYFTASVSYSVQQEL